MTALTIEAYTYPDLSQEAKYKVQAWWANGMGDVWEEDSEYWLEQLAALGYEGIDFCYSGFYSQGDGASIACTVNIQQFIKRNKLGRTYAALLYWVRQVFGEDGGALRVTRSTTLRYVHEYMLHVDADDLLHDLWWGVDPERRPKVERAMAQAEEIAPMVLAEVQEWSRKIYRALQQDYEYQLSDEAMAETCEANGYLFDRFGNPVHHLRKAA